MAALPPHDRSSPAGATANSPREASALTVRQLAHELNSLLDGSMRSVSLVLGLISGAANPCAGDHLTAAAHKLLLARQAMQEMAELLQRAMNPASTPAGSFHSDLPLAAAVDRIVAGARAFADEHGVAVTSTVDPHASRIPIGPLGHVIANGLRNAMEACAVVPPPRRVSLAVFVDSTSQLVIEIADTGSGVSSGGLTPASKPGGHGLGLEICRTLVASLDGALSLDHHPSRRGAMFRAVVPIRRLHGR